MPNTLFPEIESPETDFPLEDIPVVDTPADPMPSNDNTPDGPYQFATGDLSSFMHDMSEEKEQMNIEQMPTAEEFVDAGKQTIPANTARKTGKFIANMTDYALATGLSLISGLDVDDHKADPDSKHELESIITEYIKESGGEIPVWLQLVICLIVTYGLQLPGAIRIRNQRKEDKQ